MNQPASIAVIGLGNWGAAIAQYLASRGNQVIAWTRDQSLARAIQDTGRHPHVFTDMPFSPKVRVTTDISEASAAPLVIYALPSPSLPEVVPLLTLRAGVVFVSAVKGFEPNTAATPLQFVERRFGASISYAVISGPSFAADVMHGRMCGLVAGSRDIAAAKMIAELFSSASMRVYTSADPIGVELGGALKNVIALAAGICDGLNLGESARAGLITRGLAEMMRFAEALGADRYTLSGLSGLGDLIMTATSMQSRNYLVGFRLGKGERLEDILCAIGSVAESVKSAPLVSKIARERKLEMPISEKMAAILSGSTTIAEGLQQLFQRPLKSE